MISLGLLYWLILILILVFWGWSGRGADGKWLWPTLGGSLVLWILLALLGYKVFGAPLGH